MTTPLEAKDATAERTSHEGYRIVIEPAAEPVRAVVAGETVVDSTRALVMRETRLPPVFYFPRDDVRTEFLVPTNHHTDCPFKGNASYWSLDVGGTVVENAAWSYEDPYDEASTVKGYLAFDWNSVDAWFAGETALAQPPSEDLAAVANPLVDWLLLEAWKAKTSPELVAALADALVRHGFPLWRLRLFIRTLHPQLFAYGFLWQKGIDGIQEFQASHENVQSDMYTSSPFYRIINGEGGIRRRLEGPSPRLDFPVLEDLVREGATDYVAMPLRFSDGQINILVLTSDRPGGFSTHELGQLYEILPTLSCQVESHAQRLSSLSLLRAYLGRNAGPRVLDGLVKRGDGEDIHAVIWFSDLRNSTQLAEAQSRDDYLATVNQYFDCVAGAVIDNGGEVLKFIGDAILAIFAIGDAENAARDSCARALDAFRDAEQRLAAVNREREADGKPALAFGAGLHVGDLTYGNIGTEHRLDFTVIGAAVNEASRIEGLCKPLGRTILVSSRFAAGCPRDLVSLGEHDLRGVREPQEIFTLRGAD